MTLGDLENQGGAQLQSLAAGVPETIERFAAAPRRTLRRVVGAKTIRPALAMSAACLGAIVIGSLVHRRNAWGGLNAIATALPAFRERRRFRPSLGARPRARGTFEPLAALAGIGAICVGSFVLAVAQEALAKKVGKGRLSLGVMTALTALALDRLVGARTFWPSLKHALGKEGLAITYGALGAAGALASQPEPSERPDPSGGDIAAGVPAM